MKRYINIGLILFTMFAIMGMQTGSAQSIQQNQDRAVSNSATGLDAMLPWYINTVDSDTDVGQHVSVDMNYGKTFISYYDANKQDLRLAMHVGAGGNCGPSNTWQCQIVDSIGDVGQYNSITTKPSENETRVFISYYNATTGALKYATGICNATCTFTPRTIDTGNPSLFSYKGKYTSVKYDWYGIAHISYYSHNLLLDDALMYAHWVGDELGNCGTGPDTNDWQCDEIQSGDGVGMFTSIDVDANDEPSIAYYDSANSYPKVASYVGSGGTCGPGSSWNCWSVINLSNNTGQYVSLAVEDSGRPHIAYYNESKKSLEYARWVGTGGDCGFNISTSQSEWKCDEIEEMGSSLTAMGLSLALDMNGYPVIAYQDTSVNLAPAALKIAFPGARLGLVPGETNCGPETPFSTWYCRIIDGGGSYTDEGGSVSLVFSTSGLATIAYLEMDAYEFPTQGNLKVAYQRLQLFLPLTLQD